MGRAQLLIGLICMLAGSAILFLDNSQASLYLAFGLAILGIVLMATYRRKNK